jgi:hypothetical protein
MKTQQTGSTMDFALNNKGESPQLFVYQRYTGVW